MDLQHEDLKLLMRALAERDAAGASKGELSAQLRQLEAVTVGHFRDEERHMADVGHPKLDTHQLIHRDLLAMLRRHIAEFESGSGGRLGCNLLSFFKYWLGAHIEGMDRQIAETTGCSLPARAYSGEQPKTRVAARVNDSMGVTRDLAAPRAGRS
jgi:hemerythrin-like metal-binding protein